MRLPGVHNGLRDRPNRSVGIVTGRAFSNRGHNSIVIYSVDQANGKLGPIGWESTRGRTPRFFGLDPTGRLLYAANLDSDNIVAFRVDTETGKLTPTGQVVETASPSCIIFAHA